MCSIYIQPLNPINSYKTSEKSYTEYLNKKYL